jgi:hypothetical protein
LQGTGLKSSEISFANPLYITRIRLAPNSDAKNIRLELFACVPSGKTATIFSLTMLISHRF